MLTEQSTHIPSQYRVPVEITARDFMKLSL
jgi:hypothetical protein